MQKSKTKPKQKKKKKRCIICKKKLILTDQKCRCGIVFCPKHRLPEQHNCSFDFKAVELDANKCGLGGGTFEKIIQI